MISINSFNIHSGLNSKSKKVIANRRDNLNFSGNAGPTNFREIKFDDKTNSGIFVGARPGKRFCLDEDVDFLSEQGIKYVINVMDDACTDNLTRESVSLKDKNISFRHIPIDNTNLYPDSPKMRKIYEIVENPNNLPIYIHCNQGISRSPQIAEFCIKYLQSRRASGCPQ